MEVLLHNKGFEMPEQWASYARKHDFRKVETEWISACPDCGRKSSARIGQYVYYSNLFGLRSCPCGLIYSDLKLSEDVCEGHFETAYKDETYFDRGRRPIYRQIADLVKRYAPRNGSVLDIGGAQGHLAKMIKRRRPDLSITVNDLSEKACEYARDKFGLKALCAPLSESGGMGVYDTVLLIDILYYEKDISKAWKAIASLSKSGVVLRVPNKLWLIRASLLIKMAFNKKRLEMMDNVPFFNPEHIYIFRASYLRKKLLGLGFKKVRVLPSRGLVGTNAKTLAEGLFFLFAMAVYYASFGKAVITPSQLVVASK